MAAPMDGRCSFFVAKKKRFCKMIVGKGKLYCGEHANMEEGGSSGRVVCPLDPNHTVTLNKLEKHLKRCNSRQRDSPVYYVENRNGGSADEDEKLQQVSLSERSRAELESLVVKLKAAVEGLDVDVDVDVDVRSHPVLQDELSDPRNGGSALKHLKQQSSILGHLEQLGLLGGARCFVEFGAGRGKLSHWIHEALKTRDGPEHEDLTMLLVERCSPRFKVDGKHQDAGVQFERLQVDIQHLDLGKVPVLQKKKLPLVGVGKHLCGAATDMALRCLLESPGSGSGAENEPPQKRLRPSPPSKETDDPESPDSGPDPGPDPGPGPGTGPGPGPVLGLVVALCCHHRCEWRHYVGQRFFRQRGLGAAEFSAFCRMSSWATCGLRPANQDRADQDRANQDQANHRRDEGGHEPAEERDAVNGFLTVVERELVGRLCKLLINSGRRDFLETNGFNSKLIQYVDEDVTLENVLLTSVPSTSSS